VQAAVSGEVQTIEGGRHETAAGRRQHAVAKHDRRHGHQGDQGDDRNAGQALTAPAARRRGRLALWRRPAQKLCPMLM
jgi:hypothetical protein